MYTVCMYVEYLAQIHLGLELSSLKSCGQATICAARIELEYARLMFGG